MKIAVVLNQDVSKKEYIGEVVERAENALYVSLSDKIKEVISESDKHVPCQLRIVVDNVLYNWDNVEITYSKAEEAGDFKMVVTSNPKVYNRRKYPRMPLLNNCAVKIKDTGDVFDGRMANISANGFAFAVKASVFESLKGRDVVLKVEEFDVLEDGILEGCVIRCSNNDGEYIVGCRMPQDSKEIKEFISKNYSE